MNKEYTDSEVLTILQAILDSSCTMAGRQITVFLPTDPEGKLLVNRSVNYPVSYTHLTLPTIE